MPIPSVNFHLWQPCNMRCKFCFATFLDVKQTVLPKGHLPKEQTIQVVEQLAMAGVEKITFVGGEPTLCPWLPELLHTAKQLGMTTMIVTNGSRLTSEYLDLIQEHTDWIALSIDSVNADTQLTIGRAVSGKVISDFSYAHIVQMIKDRNIRFKVNTVVNRFNLTEDMSQFIVRLQPERWKLFQVLPIEGQNSGSVTPFLISEEEFQQFVKRHSHLEQLGIAMQPEDNDAMTGTYVMIDPAGRFFDNVQGKLTYSRPILEAGVAGALTDIAFDFSKFVARGGMYAWQNEAKVL